MICAASRRSVSAVCALAALTFGSPAARTESPAETPAELAARWGLIGDWRAACGGPVSPANPVHRFLVREGRLVEENLLGDRTIAGTIDKAALREDGALVMEIDYPGGRRERIAVRYGPGARRIVSDRDVATDQYAIRNGRMTANGELTPAESRCLPESPVPQRQ
ncbi:MAG: hypothetical protein U1E28_02550 [Beijerinckiaceae bacterium]